MKIYLEPSTKMEDLVNMLEEIKPGLVKSRLVLEVDTGDDKALSNMLLRLADRPARTITSASKAPSKPGNPNGRRGRRPANPPVEIVVHAAGAQEPSFLSRDEYMAKTAGQEAAQ